MSQFLKHAVIHRTGSDPWGNVFFTAGYRLFIDMTSEPHEWAMKRLRIDRMDVLVSGSINSYGISFRSPPGVDMKEITDDQAMAINEEIKQLLRNEKLI